MAHYVDGFVLPIPTRNIDAYRRMARKAGKVWREHGALDYKECVGDDVKVGKVTSFPRASSSSPTRQWCFRGSCSSRGPTATASTPR